jgi:exodeoxyribonuclease VII small subunit
MPETHAKKVGAFEKAIERLEEIVKKMEAGEISLDESVELFREGRMLIGRCEELLKAAQDEVEAASREAVGERTASTRGNRTTQASGGDGLPL